MSIENMQLADKVVTAFQNILTDDTKSQISEKEFHELNLMVREALSQQLSHTAASIEELAKKLRSMTDHQDIGL